MASDGPVSDQATRTAPPRSGPTPDLDADVPGVSPGPTRLPRGAAADLLPDGARVAGFEILEILGRGGVGCVYLARDLTLDDRCAVKVVPLASSARDDLSSHLLHEFRLRAGLGWSPHLLQVERPRLEDVEGRHCLVMPMELADGGSLRAWMSGRRSSGESAILEAIAVARQACEGVAAVHASGRVHLDIKPENLLLVGDQLKVADFGSGRHLARLSDGPAALLADRIGTPAYMAPEQFAAARSQDVGPAADVWALGVLLYELLDGARPFDGTESELEARVRDESLFPAMENIPAHLRAALLSCLERAPARRPADAGRLLADLAAADSRFARPVAVAPRADPIVADKGWTRLAPGALESLLPRLSPDWLIVPAPVGYVTSRIPRQGLTDGELAGYMSDAKYFRGELLPVVEPIALLATGHARLLLPWLERGWDHLVPGASELRLLLDGADPAEVRPGLARISRERKGLAAVVHASVLGDRAAAAALVEGMARDGQRLEAAQILGRVLGDVDESRRLIEREASEVRDRVQRRPADAAGRYLPADASGVALAHSLACVFDQRQQAARWLRATGTARFLAGSGLWQIRTARMWALELDDPTEALRLLAEDDASSRRSGLWCSGPEERAELFGHLDLARAALHGGAPQDVPNPRYMGLAWMRLFGDEARARALLAEAERRSPDFSGWRELALAWAESGLGKSDAARCMARAEAAAGEHRHLSCDLESLSGWWRWGLEDEVHAERCLRRAEETAKNAYDLYAVAEGWRANLARRDEFLRLVEGIQKHPGPAERRATALVSAAKTTLESLRDPGLGRQLLTEAEAALAGLSEPGERCFGLALCADSWHLQLEDRDRAEMCLGLAEADASKPWDWSSLAQSWRRLGRPERALACQSRADLLVEAAERERG